MVTEHCARGVKGGVTRAYDIETQENLDGIDRRTTLVAIVCGRWGSRGMLCENSVHQAQRKKLIRKCTGANASVFVNVTDHISTRCQRGLDSVKELRIKKNVPIGFQGALGHKV